ncbi:hypothetical protein [Streptomyces zaomyceticus]|uniref:hypothetical protein n=1 Tax=Streptomyces zaomyceticus TaxID=68286 RepID=UPI0037B8942A
MIRSTCAVNGVAYGACAWDMPFVRAGESVDPPSLALPTVPAAATLAYTVTLHARDRSGVLWRYEGTSDVRRPFAARKRVGGGWNAYTTVTPLRSTTAGGEGDLVARDRNGVLWYYRGTGDPGAPFAPRERVGGGWNTYDLLF